MTEAQSSPRHDDELTRRYREASAQDPYRPGPQVRQAVRAHAQLLLASRQAEPDTTVLAGRPAANQSRWKLSLLASIALFGLTGLLFLQFERGTPEEKELAFGQPSPTAASAESASTTATAPPAPTAAPPSAPARQPEPKTAAKADAAAKPVSPPVVNAPVVSVAPADTEKSTSQRPSPAPALAGQAIKQAAPLPEAPKAGLAKAAPAVSAEQSAPPALSATPAQAAPAIRRQEAEAQANSPARSPTAASESAKMADSANIGESRGAISQTPGPAAEPLPTARAAPPAPVAPVAPVAPAAPAAMIPMPAAPAAPVMAPPAVMAPAPVPTPAPLAATAPASKDEITSPQSAARARLSTPKAGPQNPAIALHEAARSGRVSQIESLIRRGTAIDTPDEAGRTPLILAVISGQTAVVKRLLALGANPALTDRDGLNALQHARRLGLTGIAKLIEEGS
ncbi:MAG: ankyrin repeat domain-containing protein [Pseudomonadota bacterium]